MRRFNLSEWGLRHRALVLYFMVALTVIGALSYTRLGQSEDPPFTFKAMVVRTGWPGASAEEVERQVTDRIEKKLQELPQLDFLRSYSRAGESLVFVMVRGDVPPRQVPEVWYQVRKKIGDIRNRLPRGVEGPSFNDEFGDVFGNLYALVGEGYSWAQLKQQAEMARAELLRVPSVARVDFFGEQESRIFVELSNTRLATLGVDVASIMATLQQQNAVAAQGAFHTSQDNIRLRVSGGFDALEPIRDTVIRAGGRSLRLGDIARVWRGTVDPPAPRLRYMGRDALGVGVSMAAGGDIIALGRNLEQAVEQVRTRLPVGLEMHTISSQPRAVQRSVNEFVRSLAEAVAIVLAVSLLSLGLRTGVVVAVSIPVVLAVTFLFMHLFDVGLHKISLGALILSLGLLVDDAIIAVEMMATKMEQGWDRVRAASYAYTSTAAPMLSGTLVTAAGFLPIATAASTTGEYTRSLFQVTVIALLVSWVAAVVFVPYLGYRLLPQPGGDAGKLRGPGHEQPEHEHYDTRFYRRLRAAVTWCVRRRKTVIVATLLAFGVAVWGFGQVPKQFFPDSTRPELLVDLRLPEGSSHAATDAEVRRLETILAAEPGIENYVAWVGSGSPRFYLPLEQQLALDHFAQFVVLTAGPQAREQLRARLIRLFDEDFPGLHASITRLENGPPVGFPVQFRVSGPELATLRGLAGEVAQVMRANPQLSNVQFDTDDAVKVIRIAVDQDKARLLGVSSADLAAFLNTSLDGQAITQFREGTELIDVQLRGAGDERTRLSQLADLAVPTRAGTAVPLAQIARLEYGFEEGIVWRRNRLPAITVRANVYGGVQAPVASARVEAALHEVRQRLPVGYRIEVGGAVEESAKGASSVAAGMPLFILVVFTVLMLQLQSFPRVMLVVLTAPLGLIGVTLALLAFGKPFGFVAMLGTIALSGMIMRNSVILVDQIEQDEAAGKATWEAVIDSTVRRFRPIALTAAAAILAMIPLTRSAFFGPMAVAIMGGLLVATLLTVLFLPALYAAWYRVREPEGRQ
ncbi:MAG: efflux RND transporter permease subunit [Betaproteobacteria bacterium]|nr:efflux RND transporter permease subunit [Betaproteobacteria bacterium]